VRCVISDRQDLARDVTQTIHADCVMAMFGENKEPWRILCKQIATERDPGRVPGLVTKVSLLARRQIRSF
jgi:hypothetical protein